MLACGFCANLGGWVVGKLCYVYMYVFVCVGGGCWSHEAVKSMNGWLGFLQCVFMCGCVGEECGWFERHDGLSLAQILW